MIAKEMHKAENAQDKNNRGVWAIATATAKNRTANAAKITGIIRGVIAKTMGTPRAAPFVVLRRC